MDLGSFKIVWQGESDKLVCWFFKYRLFDIVNFFVLQIP